MLVKICFQAYFSLEKTSSGNISSSVYAQSDGKKNAMLDVFLAHAVRKGFHAVKFNLSIRQTLFPLVIPDLHLHLGANSSSDR